MFAKQHFSTTIELMDNYKLKHLTKSNRNNGQLGITNSQENPAKNSKPASLKDKKDYEVRI